MPLTCAVRGCTNTRFKKSQEPKYLDCNISFHDIPKAEPVREKWIEVLRKIRDDDDWNPSLSVRHVVCSDHFIESDFDPDPLLKRKRLKSGVIPSVFDR